MSMLLGIDVGTSATKVVCVDETGGVRAAAEAPHEISMPHAGWSEQEPEWWWSAACEAIERLHEQQGIDPATIEAVGLSGQMHGSVFLAGDSTPQRPQVVRPALLWNDQRTASQCRTIEERAGGREALIRMTGNPALTGLTAPKILWLKEHEPEHYAQVAHIVLPKDFIAYRLTGEIVTDVGDGSGTLLLDPRTRTWRDDLIEALGLDRAHLPRCVESSRTIGSVTPFAAEATGLRAGTPVIIGSGDQMTGAVGAGIVREGIVSATLGTSGVVFAHAGSSVPDDESGRLQIMCAAVPDEYCVYGCMLSAAGALQWYQKTFAPDSAFEALDRAAGAVSPGCDGLLFLPYLTGERCPHPDPAARGGFIGLTARHSAAHCVRAVLEGVALGMADILDLVRGLGIEPTEIRMAGGGAKSPLWRGIHAAAFQTPVVTLNTAEGSAYGAALLAGVGHAVWPSVQAACDACLSEKTRQNPDPETTSRYERVHHTFDALYPLLKDVFPRLEQQ